MTAADNFRSRMDDTITRFKKLPYFPLTGTKLPANRDPNGRRVN
jgi:hypothetical protein